MAVMVEGAEEWYERGQEGTHQAALFYVEDGMVASPYTRWIQGAFDNLVRLFDRVGLRKKFRKTVGMVFCPCQAEVNQSEAAYGIRITG